MTTDARLAVELPRHPKTKKLIRKLGPEGAWYLVCLFLWTASNRPDGDLIGMTHDDIELAIDWPGQPGTLVNSLLEVGFLEGTTKDLRVHGWAEHNPWAAGSKQRSEKSKWAALCKSIGKLEAARTMPEYAARHLLAVPESASGMPQAESGTPRAGSGMPKCGIGMPNNGSGTAPSPKPLPFPIPIRAALPAEQEEELYRVEHEFRLDRITTQERNTRVAAIHQAAGLQDSKAASA